MRSIKIPELVIGILFFIGLVLALTQDVETDQVPETTITEAALENSSEVESAI